MDAPRQRSRGARTLGRALLGVLLAVIALVASAVLQLRLPLTRRVAAAWLTEFVSREMTGALVIGRFDALEPRDIVARDVTLFDALGNKIIHADRLELQLDLQATLSGRVVFRSARLLGASVRLIDEGEGLPTLLTTFDSSYAAKKSGGEPLQVVVNGIELQRVTLRGDLLGLTDFRAENLQALGQLQIGGAVRARIDQASATMTEPFGYVAVIDALTGTISTAPGEGVSLTTHTQRNAEQATAQVRYGTHPEHPDAPDELDLRVQASDVSAETLHGLGYDWVPDLAVPISGALKLQGPVRELVLDADMHTPAGKAAAHGAISKTRGVDVTITTPGMELAQLLPEYPRVHARGTLRIAMKPEEDQPHLHLEIEPLSWGMLRLPAFALDGVVIQQGLRIDRIDGRSRGSHISGRGRILEGGRVALDLHTVFDDIAGDPNFTRWARGAQGSLHADVHVESPQADQSNLSFSGNIVLHDFRLGLLQAEKLSIAGSARGDPQHPRVQLLVGGGPVRLGAYKLGDASLWLEGGPQRYHATGLFVDAGRRTFNVDAHVKTEADGFAIDADPIEFTVGEGSWRGVMRGLRLHGKHAVELELLRLASRSQRLEAHGKLLGNGRDHFEAVLQNFDLAALRALVGDQLWLEQGHADTRIVLDGDVADPDLLVQGALRDGVMRGVRDIDALYLIKYKAGLVEANGEVDLGPRGLLRLDGTVQVERKRGNPIEALRRGNYALELSAERLALDLLPALARAGVKGAVGGELRAQGTLQRPELTGKLRFDRLTLPDSSPFSITADGSFVDGQLRTNLTLDDAVGSLGAADAQVQLDWSALSSDPKAALRALLRNPWHLSGFTTSRRLDAMPAPIAARMPYPAAIATRFEFHKSGPQTQGKLEFDLDWQQAIDDGGCMQDARATGHGVLRLEQGTSHVALELASAGTQIADFEIAIDTPVDRWAEQGAIEQPRMVRSSAHANVDAMHQVPYLCEYGDGKLRASLELDGGLTNQPVLAMKLESEFMPRVQKTSRRRQAQARSCAGDAIRARMQLDSDRDQLSGSAHMEGCHGGAADLRGRVAVQWDRLLVLPAPRRDGALQANLSLDGAQLKPLLERLPGVINAEGKARGEVSLSGTLQDARWSGQVGVEAGRLYLVSTGQELTNINAAVEFLGNWAKLEQLQAQVGNGKIELSGGIGLAGIWPDRARLALRLKDVPIKREGVEIASHTGNAAIDATIGRDAAQIKLVIEEMRVKLPEESNRALQPLSSHQDVVVVSETPQRPIQPYVFQIEVGGKPITVERTDFLARIEPKLSVRYADPDLSVEGRVTFNSGEFEVFGKRFQVNAGSLTFDGTTDFNPEVYLMALQKPEPTGLSPVTVWVTGTLERPEVTFSVDVCSGETAAISYLLSGRCGGNTDDNLAQDSADAPAAFLAGVVGGVLTLGAQRELKGLAPRIAIESTEQGRQRVHAGFSSESLIPKPLRGLVKRIYIAGGVLSANSQTSAAEGAPVPENTSLEFLLELYFAHNLVGSGRFAPPDWGIDFLWEP